MKKKKNRTTKKLGAGRSGLYAPKTKKKKEEEV